MRTNTLVALLSVLTVLAACSDHGPVDVSRLQAEVAVLKTELAAVKLERDDLRFGPSRLLAEVDALANKGDWPRAKILAETLITRHPSSPEAVKAREVVKMANESFERSARETALADAKRAEGERRLKAQEERRLAAALSKMSKKVDQIENITWYRDQTSPRFSNYNGFFLYMGKRADDAPWLRLRVQYNADTWLFVESFLVVADDRRFEYGAVKFERDNSSEIWEWYDETARAADLDMVQAVIDSKNAVIRFNGRQYRRDRTISGAEKAALRNVLDAYKVLGGK